MADSEPSEQAVSFAAPQSTGPTIFQPQVAVVDFHHARGPEVELWVSPEGQSLYDRNDWSLLPFMALSDGAHAMVEDFSYFTLLSKGISQDLDTKPTPEDKSSIADGNEEAQTQQPDTSAQPAKSSVGPNNTSLFGIACTRQIRTEKLKVRSPDVTRSSVQKAVVVITDNAQGLGELRTRLGAVTQAWFAQLDFSDVHILKEFQESLVRTSALQQDDREHYFGLSLREVIHEFRHQTLVLVKCMLLQRKMLFFGSKCERLCMLQFALLSLIPGLMRNLQDSAHPALDTYSAKATSAISLRTSERASLLAYMGLPLHVFGKGSFFGPYTPLQHLDVLADYDTKSYIVGSTNSLLLQQKERYADILINLDEQNNISIMSSSLRSALALSAADRRWIDHLTQVVLDTWDPSNPSRPKNHGYAGSEEAIRLQFEEYILSLLSCAAYQEHYEPVQISEGKSSVSPRASIEKENQNPNPKLERTTSLATPDQTTNRSRSPSPTPTASTLKQPSSTTNSRAPSFSQQSTLTKPSSNTTLDPDPHTNASDFSTTFLHHWRTTNNYALFSRLTSTQNPPIWHITPPTHPTAGGLNVEDVQRRLAQSVAELHLDEKMKEGRENLARTFEAGREKVIWVREGLGRAWENRKRERDAVSGGSTTSSVGPSDPTTLPSTSPPAATAESTWTNTLRDRATQMKSNISSAAAQVQSSEKTQQLQASARENAAKAGAYFSSWGSWAKEKGKAIAENRGGGNTTTTTTAPAKVTGSVATGINDGGGK